MKNAYLFHFALIMLASCAYSGVKTLGAGVYEITDHGLAIGQSPTELRAQAIREAKAFCDNQKRSLSIIEADKEGGGYGKLPESDVQFRCVNSK